MRISKIWDWLSPVIPAFICPAFFLSYGCAVVDKTPALITVYYPLIQLFPIWEQFHRFIHVFLKPQNYNFLLLFHLVSKNGVNVLTRLSLLEKLLHP
jgi:hypothetical protein